MKALAIIAILLLAGCGKATEGPGQFVQATHADLLTWGPDQFGVVCYRQRGFEGIACVKVTP